jgi:predicted nucleic acid-binding protein
MKFLADTNVLSELRKGKTGDQNVHRWGLSIDLAEIAMSVISLHELELGILNIARRDERQGLHLRAWLDHALIPQFADRILSVDPEIALRCAALNVPNPQPLADALIAATALVHNLTVVTRNVRHFASIDVRLLNPWDVPA